MQIIDLFKQSIYSKEFYRGISQHRLLFSFKYFYGVVFVLALVVTIVMGAYAVPGFNFYANTAAPAIIDGVPEDLVITIKDGEAVASYDDVVYIPWPEEVFSEDYGIEGVGRENFFVIDTQNPFTPSLVREYDTVFLLTKNAVIASFGDSIDVSVIDEDIELVINKTELESFLLRAQKAAKSKWAIMLLIIVIYVGFLLLYTLKLFYVLVLALAIWGLATLRRVEMNYKRAYQIGLHAISLSLVVYTLQLIFPEPRLPLLFTGVALFIVWFVALAGLDESGGKDGDAVENRSEKAGFDEPMKENKQNSENEKDDVKPE